MSKKFLIISSSPRKGGNSETLAKSFADGALAAGNKQKNPDLQCKSGFFSLFGTKWAAQLLY